MSSSVTSSPTAISRQRAPARSRNQTTALALSMRVGFTSKNSGPWTSTKCGLSDSHRAIEFSTSTIAASLRSGRTARQWNATDHVLRSTWAPRWRSASERKSSVRSSTSFCEASTAGCHAPVSRRQPTVLGDEHHALTAGEKGFDLFPQAAAHYGDGNPRRHPEVAEKREQLGAGAGAIGRLCERNERTV